MKYCILFSLFFLNCILFRLNAQSKIAYNKLEKPDSSQKHYYYIIIENDTITGTRQSISKKQIVDFCEELNDDKIIRLYKDIVFNNLQCGQFSRVFTKQWISEIIIYFDENIPRFAQKGFKDFYKSLKINNLKISYTNNKNKANYFITTSSSMIPDKQSLASHSESYPYNHVTYNYNEDKNSKFYGGILKVNLDQIIRKELILSKLKQMFFVGLGQFTIDQDMYEDSLLSFRYNNSKTISKTDLKLLKLHYLKLHDTPLSCHYYSSFIKSLQKKCL